MCLFVGSEFLVSHRRIRTPRYFYGLSLLELCLIITNESLTRWGVYPCLLLPDTSFLYPIIQSCDSVGLRPTCLPNQTPNAVLIFFFNHALTPINYDVPVYMQCNAPLHVISCHIYNECYTDNSNHTIHHLSWTIILIAYNFHTITHFMSIYLYTYISISYHTTTTKHAIQNQATTPLILEAKCDIYYAHKTVHKMTPRQAINRLPNQPSTSLNHALNRT